MLNWPRAYKNECTIHSIINELLNIASTFYIFVIIYFFSYYSFVRVSGALFGQIIKSNKHNFIKGESKYLFLILLSFIKYNSL